MAFANLSNDSLLMIMDKLSLRSLVTLRKTCSGMDAMVEQYRYHFSKKTEEFIRLKIRIEGYYDKKPEVSYFVHYDNKTVQLQDPVSQLSAVGISEVTITFIKSDDIGNSEDESSLIPEIIDVLQKLKISPVVVKFNGVGDRLVEEALLQLKPQEVNIFVAAEGFDIGKISQMAVVKKAKKVDVHSFTPGVAEEYETIKGMNSVISSADKEGVQQFIRSVLNTENIGRLHTIEFDLMTPTTRYRQIFDSVVDEEQMAAEFFTHFDDFDLPRDLLRRHVVDSSFFLVNLNSTHQMIIVEKPHTWVTIKILEKDALLQTLVELVFNEKVTVDLSGWKEDFEKAESTEDREDIFWDSVYYVIDGLEQQRDDDAHEILVEPAQ